MAEVDFTQDVVANGDFGDATKEDTNNGTSKTEEGSSSNAGVGSSSSNVASASSGADDNSTEERKIFIGGLSWETREPQLKSYFEKFGEVESVNLKLNPMTGRYT